MKHMLSDHCDYRGEFSIGGKTVEVYNYKEFHNHIILVVDGKLTPPEEVWKLAIKNGVKDIDDKISFSFNNGYRLNMQSTVRTAIAKDIPEIK